MVFIPNNLFGIVMSLVIAHLVIMSASIMEVQDALSHYTHIAFVLLSVLASKSQSNCREIVATVNIRNNTNFINSSNKVFHN